jgi:hypothetical protein
MARIGKPRKRRVWEGETRREWKRSKRADLPAGKFNRHLTTKEKRRAEERAAKRGGRGG